MSNEENLREVCSHFFAACKRTGRAEPLFINLAGEILVEMANSYLQGFEPDAYEELLALAAPDYIPADDVVAIRAAVFFLKELAEIVAKQLETGK